MKLDFKITNLNVTSQKIVLKKQDKLKNTTDTSNKL